MLEHLRVTIPSVILASFEEGFAGYKLAMQECNSHYDASHPGKTVFRQELASLSQGPQDSSMHV